MTTRRGRWFMPLVFFVIGALFAGGTFVAAFRWSLDDRPMAAPSVSPDAEPMPLTVITWNVCAKAEWRCPAGGRLEMLASAIVNAARRQEADVLLLQEICSNMLPTLKDNLGSDWRVHFRQAMFASKKRGAKIIAPETCADTESPYGQAIAFRLSLESADSGSGISDTGHSWLRPLPSPEAVRNGRMEQRLAICVRLRSPRLQLCSAHLSTVEQDPGGDFRAAQIKQLAEEARTGQQLGYRTIVGGDLNTSPDATVAGTDRPILHPLYTQSAECDPAKEQATFGDLKIDYLFSGPGISPLGCEAIPTELSDHHMLAARYRLNPRGVGVQKGAEVLKAAYASNDQARADEALLAHALALGFSAVEVDVQAPRRGDAFVVGSDRADAWGRTLEDHYLQILQDRVDAYGGRVHAGSTEPFMLVVQIRGKNLRSEIYAAMDRLLAQYSSMLCRTEDGRLVVAGVRVVVPETPGLRAYLADRKNTFLFVSSTAPWHKTAGKALPPGLVAMGTVKLAVGSDGTLGPTIVANEVRLAHTGGFQIRFWGYEGLTSGPRAWRVWAGLRDAGVDYIAADDYEALAEVLRSTSSAEIGRA